jgi:tetratricopeptide (TPR) repeat protein
MNQPESNKNQALANDALQEIYRLLQSGLVREAAVQFTTACAKGEKALTTAFSQVLSPLVFKALQCLADTETPASKKLYSTGGLFLESGYPVEAERVFRQLSAEDKGTDGKKMHGIALMRLGRLQEALSAFELILSTNPKAGDVWFEQGKLLFAVGQSELALQSFENASRLNPASAEIWLELGNVKKALMHDQQALDAFTKAIANAPKSPEAFNNRGTVHKLLGKRDEALADFTQALALDPLHLYAHLNRGALFAELKRPDLAQLDFEKAIVIAPHDTNTFYGLAEALHQQGLHEKALACLESAILLDKSKPYFYLSRGNCLQALGKFTQAIESYAEALQVDASFAEAYINWGTALQELGRHEEAIQVLDKAIALRPDYFGAYWNKANSMLCLELSAESWKIYEQRHYVKSPDSRKMPDLPLLGGMPPDGKKLLMQWDQRFGDIIQVLRYIPIIEKTAAQCVWQIAPQLRSLVQSSFPDIHIVAPGQDAHGMEYQLPITSLPFALKTFSEDDIPVGVPYLTPSASAVNRWAAALPDASPRVGLVWRGQPLPPGRSIPLTQLAPVMKMTGLAFCSLQHQATPAEIEMLSQHGVQHFGEVVQTFEDTAAIMHSLDMVITVDTSVAHLAGALGIPCWVLLKFGGDWRWHLQGDKSAWYPTSKIYRQPSPGAWEAVVQKIVTDLSARFQLGRCSSNSVKDLLD